MIYAVALSVDGGPPLLIAHRAPRTAAACAVLAAAGARMFEIDVRIIGGELVASHYFAVPGFRGRLQHDTWRLRWRGLARADDPLAERIAAVPGGSSVLLDLKEHLPAARERLVRALVRHLDDPAPFVVSSPDVDDLAQLRQAGFRTWRSVDGRVALDQALADERLAEQALTVRHTSLDPERIARVHKRGVAVVAWTVNDAARARQLRVLGVDGVTTDRVAAISAGLRAAG